MKDLPDDYDFENQAEVLASESMIDDFYGIDPDRLKSPRQIAVENVKKLNADQFAAFQRISNSLLGRADHRLFFVEGAGGTGY